MRFVTSAEFHPLNRMLGETDRKLSDWCINRWLTDTLALISGDYGECGQELHCFSFLLDFTGDAIFALSSTKLA